MPSEAEAPPVPVRPFLKSIATVAGGAALAQAVPLALAPLLSRLYSPADLGVFAAFSAAAALAGVVSTGRYELAVLLPERSEDAAALALAALGLAFGAALLVAALAPWSGPWFSRLFGRRDLAAVVPLLAPAVLLAGVSQTLASWGNRMRRYRALSLSRVFQNAGGAVVAVGLGVVLPSAAGLVWGALLGQAAAVALLAVAARGDRELFRRASRARVLAGMRRYADFPRINLAHALVDGLQANGLPLLVSSFFGPATLGFYALSARALRTPLAVIGAPVSLVFYQEAATRRREGSALLPLARGTLAGLAFVALPVFAVVALWGPELFGLVFGEAWRPAGTYSRLLAPWICVGFVVSPLTQLPLVVERQKTAFALGVFGNTLLLGALASGKALLGTPEGAFALLSAVETVYLACVAAWLLGLARYRAPFPGAQSPSTVSVGPTP